MRQQIEKVQRGDEPDGVIRNPKLNEIIHLTFSTGQARMANELAAAK